MITKDSLLGESRTRGYKPSVLMWPMWYYAGNAMFNLGDVEAMVRDPQISLGLKMIKAPLYTLEWNVKCKNVQVAKFVDENMKLFWKPNINKVLRAVEYGFSGGEVLYTLRDNKVYFRAFKEFHPRDLRVLTDEGEMKAIRVKNIHTPMGDVDLFPPKGFWFAANKHFSHHYGRSYLMNCWEPWFEKRARDGAIDMRRLWFYKNAFHGGVIRHPAKDYVQPDGSIVPARQMAQEMGERLKTGGVIAFPNTRDENGEYQWSWQPPTINGNASEIREYPKDLDTEIMRGMGIPDNVLVEAPTTSSYAGRRVPERSFYVSLEQLVCEIVLAFKFQVMDHLVALNFEGQQIYEIVTKPIIEIMSPEGTPPVEGDVNGETVGSTFGTADGDSVTA